MPGRPRKFDPQRDWAHRVTHPERRTGALSKLKTAVQVYRDGKRSQKELAAKLAALQEHKPMSNETRVSVPASPAKHAATQAANTVGSGTLGTIVAGIVYGLLPESIDAKTRAELSGAIGIFLTIGISWAHGWWLARRKA